MKRSPELQHLSSDHHRALVVAKRARNATESTADIWDQLERFYQSELKVHFGLEERFIAPGLESLGEAELVGRLYREHQALQSFFAPMAEKTLERLHAFGEQLSAHVRFEERELFNVAQQRMSTESLAALEKACANEV